MAKKENLDEILDTNLQTKFTKNQVKRSAKFMKYRDIISVCMQDDELISLDELQEKIDKFLKGKVI